MTRLAMLRRASAIAAEPLVRARRRWLRCRLKWAEQDIEHCKARIKLAEAEAAFLPNQLQVYCDAAADLRTQLVALGRGL